LRLDSVCSIPIDEFLATRLAFTPDGQHIVIGHRSLTQYGILSGRTIRTYPFEAFAAGIEFSPDGRYLACVNDDDRQPKTCGLAKIFDTETGAPVWQVETPHPVEAGCFLENGAGLAFLYREGMRLIGCMVPSRDPLPPLDLPDWSLREMAAMGGLLTLFGQDNAPTVCQIEGASLDFYPFKVGTFAYPSGAGGRIRKVAVGAGRSKLSPGGQLLAIEVIDFGSGTHYLSLIAVETGAEGRLALAVNSVPAFTFSGDGEQFLCLTEDAENGGGLLRLWETRTMKLLGRSSFPSHYHALALHWPTRRLAAIGGGRCDIGLIQI
jgi:WD40 repeat protein